MGTDLDPYLHLLSTFRDDRRAIDIAHNVFLMGALLSKKPDNILELGIGTGFVTQTLLAGIRFNGFGRITCVDNWFDWGGKEPAGIDKLRQTGAKVVVESEERFLRTCAADQYDFLVSDADHMHSGDWVHEHLRVTRNDAFLFFHDTNSEEWPSLRGIPSAVSHLPHFLFRVAVPMRDVREAGCSSSTRSRYCITSSTTVGEGRVASATTKRYPTCETRAVA
jgi:predicted O-methyltransferase YrrM